MIRGILGLWALFGYFLVPMMRRPSSTWEGLWQLLLMGPVAWILIAPIGMWQSFRGNSNG